MSNTRRQKSAKSSHNRRTASQGKYQSPRPSHSSNKTVLAIDRSTTRLIGVWVVLGLGALSLLLRLGWLQIVDAPYLLQKARSQQSVTVRPFVPRRTIVDRSNNQMAIDRPSYTIYAHPEQFREEVATAQGKSKSTKKVKVDPQDLAQRLAPILAVQPAELLAKFQRHKTGILLGKALPAEIEHRIRALKVDGLDIRQGASDYTRFYPQGNAAAEVLGYLDGEHKAQAGIEYSQSLLLERKVSEYKLTRTAKGSILPDRVTPDFLHADDLQLKLTLDLRLQRAARQALLQKMQEWNAPRGSVIVMDAETGAIRSLVVEPTYDPNHYARDIDRAKSNALLRNWAVSDLYEPGSTFKPIAVAIGLENGIVKPDSTFFDGGSISIGKDIIRNADLEGNGTIDTAQVLQHSSNVGMVKMMQRLKPNVYHNWLQWIGLGQKSGIDLPFEERGEVRSQKEFIASPIYPANASFGQGFSITPIQLTTLVGSLANGGKLVTPYVVEGLFDSAGVQKDNPNRPKPRQIFAPTNAKAVLDMMETVVTKGSGLYAQIPGYRIAGKTGTSQKAGVGGYQQDDKKITSFVGILPVDAEHRYVVFAAIDEPRKGQEKAFGSNVAAPVVKSVMASLISIEGIPPSVAIPQIAPIQIEPSPTKETNKL
jgi:cell division protein FtsI (penicillin-binding protein 3)